jgi:hypothetical protein
MSSLYNPHDSCLDISAIIHLRRSRIEFEQRLHDRVRRGGTIGVEEYSKHFTPEAMTRKEKARRAELNRKGY